MAILKKWRIEPAPTSEHSIYLNEAGSRMAASGGLAGRCGHARRGAQGVAAEGQLGEDVHLHEAIASHHPPLVTGRKARISSGPRASANRSLQPGSERESEHRGDGLRGSGRPLPHLDTIQRSFGRLDVSEVQAHVGGAAAQANERLGATGYATGNQVAFRSAPDLRLAAHEAAHNVSETSQHDDDDSFDLLDW